MYSYLPSFVIAFHGCDQNVKEFLLSGKTPRPSRNTYDWLGSGFYCWEQNEQRAMDFAKEACTRRYLTVGVINKPAVIGLVVDLGRCLNLLDSKYLQLVKGSYDLVSKLYRYENLELPLNSGGHPDSPKRDLDCLVIENLHAIVKEAKDKPFDTVRGMFPEGNPLYDGAGFRDKNHIQICIRNQNCIKAIFDPRVYTSDSFSWLDK